MAYSEMTRCEQKKEFLVEGVSQWRWVEVAASSVVGISRDRLRCLQCHGAVRLHRQQVDHGPQDHLEHRSHKDSEHCRAGHYFNGGEHRMSSQPIE